MVEFQWDPTKAAANLKKHRVGFQEAATVLEDPLSTTFPDEAHSTQERRFVTIGVSEQGRVLVLAHKVNLFVSFKVLFQCKRHAGGVGSPQVRDFRGAMMGRADKGLILTTGTFTADAQAEAVRDGVPPIELVDGQEIVKLMEQFELGLSPRTTYDLNIHFFDEFTK